MDDLWAAKSGGVGLIIRAISFQAFQPMRSLSTNDTDGQTDRQTDRQTDGRAACNRNTALCTKVHRAVKSAHKANSIMAVIRTFTHLDCQCFTLLFKSLVRPHVEYGIPIIWFPYKMKDIEEVKKVQRRTTKQVICLHGLSYEQRL